MRPQESGRAATVAVQLYTLRSLEAPFGSLLDLVARAGAEAVETVGHHGLEAEAMRDALDARGLAALSSHVQLTALEDDLDGEIAFARKAGVGRLVVPFLAPEDRPSDAAGWSALGARLDRLGRRCREADMTLAYHNHDFELVPVEGRLGLDWLFEAADPEHLEAELDLAWIARAGRDPVAALRTWGKRTRLLHAKDLAPTGQSQDEGGWAQVGRGTLPWSELLPEALAQGTTGWIVEHDAPLDPEAVVRGGCAFLTAFLDRAAASP